MRIHRLLPFAGLLLLLSCEKTDYSDTPYGIVNLTLYLGDKDKDLNNVYASKIITPNDVNTSQNEYAGFGGIIVYHHSDGSFRAYDISCPYEVNANTTIKADEERLTATCPKCGSKYDLENFGVPISGPSSENPKNKFLRSYRVIQSGNILSVRN